MSEELELLYPEDKVVISPELLNLLQLLYEKNTTTIPISILFTLFALNLPSEKVRPSLVPSVPM